jgi:hypothetical protein
MVSDAGEESSELSNFEVKFYKFFLLIQLKDDFRC